MLAFHASLSCINELFLRKFQPLDYLTGIAKNLVALSFFFFANHQRVTPPKFGMPLLFRIISFSYCFFFSRCLSPSLSYTLSLFLEVLVQREPLNRSRLNFFFFFLHSLFTTVERHKCGNGVYENCGTS